MLNQSGSSLMQAGRAALAMLALAACSDHPTAATLSAWSIDAGGRAAVVADVSPSSVGWQQLARSLIAANNMSPLAAARMLSALGIAQYRGVSAVDSPDRDGVVPANGIASGGRSALEAQRGAVAGASAVVLGFFFPAATAALEERVKAEGNSTSGETHPQFVRGLELGRGTGDDIVARVKTDKFTTPWTGTVPTGPGMWIANGPPAGATFGGVTPWVMTSGSQFRPAPPPAFDSPAFLADLAEVVSLAQNRTGEQQANALFWNFPTGTHTPVGYWNETAAGYVTSYGLDERAATRTFALTNAAIMDALIGCWDAKYFYWTLRPSQATAGIPLSFGLPNHPSYPSGHSCASAAAGTVLGHLFPDRAAQLDARVSDAGLSRIHAGIHYRFDIDAGEAIGASVARLVLRTGF